MSRNQSARVDWIPILVIACITAVVLVVIWIPLNDVVPGWLKDQANVWNVIRVSVSISVLAIAFSVRALIAMARIRGDLDVVFMLVHSDDLFANRLRSHRSLSMLEELLFRSGGGNQVRGQKGLDVVWARIENLEKKLTQLNDRLQTSGPNSAGSGIQGTGSIGKFGSAVQPTAEPTVSPRSSNFTLDDFKKEPRPRENDFIRTGTPSGAGVSSYQPDSDRGSSMTHEVQPERSLEIGSSSASWREGQNSTAAGLRLTSEPLPSMPSVYYTPFADDGLFKELLVNQEWDALFKLTLLGPPATASAANVDICANDQLLEKVIQAPSRYLASVCNYDENPRSGASRIIVEKVGKAEKQGQRWKIKEDGKLQIRFQ